jgi:hypothetical protein
MGQCIERFLKHLLDGSRITSVEDTRVDRIVGAKCIRRSLQALYSYTTGVWTTRNAALHDSENVLLDGYSQLCTTLLYICINILTTCVLMIGTCATCLWKSYFGVHRLPSDDG